MVDENERLTLARAAALLECDARTLQGWEEVDPPLGLAIQTEPEHPYRRGDLMAVACVPTSMIIGRAVLPEVMARHTGIPKDELLRLMRQGHLPTHRARDVSRPMMLITPLDVRRYLLTEYRKKHPL